MNNHATQAAKAVAYLRKHREATTHELIKASGSVCPWRRLSEAKVKLGSRWKTTGRAKYKVYWLASKVAA